MAQTNASPQWIPVEERLPSAGQFCWVNCPHVADGHPVVELAMYVNDVCKCPWIYASAAGDADGTSADDILGVTHWMELSEPEHVDQQVQGQRAFALRLTDDERDAVAWALEQAAECLNETGVSIDGVVRQRIQTLRSLVGVRR